MTQTSKSPEIRGRFNPLTRNSLGCILIVWRKLFSEGEALQTQARSLLNIRSQIESALSTARSTRPMIFAIEVKGRASDLGELRTDPVVRVFNNAGDTTKDPATQSALKPIAYQAEFRDPVVQTASPGDLYELILDKVSENAEGAQ